MSEDEKPDEPRETEPPEAQRTDTESESGTDDLQAALNEAEARAEENWSQYLRARAEMENLRRRAEKDIANARQQSLEKLASEILGVKDSLEMGLAAASEDGADVAKLAEGSELTLRMLNQALEKFSITEVNPTGERFDPAAHEAMAAQEASEVEPNTVINVMQKGYRLGDRLLRPAMVIVAKAPVDDEPSS
ncbi:MAG: nucleotide exchange factor GrpE [Spiribacter sp.]|jgi:molecular chaperone GrpE|nr:nucleotide exchange factor GrpE [Spiribacter sp.]MDR9489321.1 nucleotide exchange factor GrpE [Spiribacter sp.]